MRERVLPPIREADVRQPSLLARWLANFDENLPRIRAYTATLNPASVAANSESVETITIAGVTTQDIISVNKPTNTAGLDLVGAWASAADTVSVKFRNATGSPIDPGQETYIVAAIRL